MDINELKKPIDTNRKNIFKQDRDIAQSLNIFSRQKYTDLDNRTAEAILNRIESKISKEILDIQIANLAQINDKASFKRLFSELPEEICNALIKRYY